MNEKYADISNQHQIPGIISFVRRTYGDDIKSEGNEFAWYNIDGDRFAFPTYEEAALDFAREIGATVEECQNVPQ